MAVTETKDGKLKRCCWTGGTSRFPRMPSSDYSHARQAACEQPETAAAASGQGALDAMSVGPDEVSAPRKLPVEHDLSGFDSGEPVLMPSMEVCRLSFDQGFQGRDIGAGLLRDAVLRTVQAAEIAGIRAI